MKFSFSDEQAEFRTMLRRFLENKSPTTEVRRLMATDDGYDRDVWHQLSQELGRVPDGDQTGIRAARCHLQQRLGKTQGLEGRVGEHEPSGGVLGRASQVGEGHARIVELHDVANLKAVFQQ